MENRVWYDFKNGFIGNDVNKNTNKIIPTLDSTKTDSIINKEETEDAELDKSIFNNITLFIIAVSFICFIILIYLFIKNIKINGEDYNQRKTRYYFTHLNGESNDEIALNTIKYGESIKEPTAIDHYRLGTTYLVNAKCHIPAAFHFNKALEQITKGETSNRDSKFILERIDDYKSHFVDHSDIPELPVQDAMLAYYKNIKDKTEELKKKNTITTNDKNEILEKVSIPKLILNKQKWHSDSQNVHDTAVFTEINDQYKIIVNANKKIKDCIKYTYQDAIKYIRNKYKNTNHSVSIDKVINILNNNYDISFMSGVKEQDIITAIWQRSYDEINADNAEEIRDSLCSSILDCIEGDNVVCMAGRVPKLWQALATLDNEKGIGTIKSKQVLRNEIYQRCAKIVNDKLGPNGSAPDEVKKAYNNGRDIIGVRECIESIYKEMDDIKTDYVDLISDDIIQLYINECKNVL
jgi:hypothetical protein